MHARVAVKMSKTLFVRNLPYTTSDSELERLFGKYGSLKVCFTVKEKGATDRCRGFGYVTFETREEAERAKSTIKVVGGRPVDISFARRRPPKVKPKPNDSEAVESASVRGAGVDVAAESEDDYEAMTEKKNKPNMADTKKNRSKSQRSEAHFDVGKIVVLGNLSEDINDESLRKKCERFGEVVSLLYPVPEREEPTAFVTYQTHRQARQAVERLANEGAVLLSKENKSISDKSLKKSRLIVRNLSFKCNEEDIRKVFERFGELVEVHIPHKPNGHMFGYAFVQFSSYFNAKKALAAVNMQEVKGRPVAVDWVVPKSKYEKSLQVEKKQLNEGNTPVGTPINDVRMTSSENEAEIDSYDAHQDDTPSQEDSEEEQEDTPSQENSEEEQEDTPSQENSEEEQEDTLSQEDSEEEHDDNDDYVSMTSSQTSEEEDVSTEQSASSKPKKVEWKDVSEGRTVFIRNLPLDVDVSDVKCSFSQFGGVRYCRIMRDNETGLGTGSAFLQFRGSPSVQSCLEASCSESGLNVRGRRLTVDLALSKKEAKRVSSGEEKTTKIEDRRNLYLAKEGVILPGSEAASELTKVDMSRRIKAQAEKKAKLSNPYFFVSKTRLSVRNLPTSVNEHSLKKLFLKASNTPGAGIVQVKILRSTERVDSKGVGRSKGFAFVEFSTHEAALAALRATNNSPSLFGKNKRLIVEFAVEDSRALKLREQRKQRLLSSRPGPTTGCSQTGSTSVNMSANEEEKSGSGLSKRHKWRLKWRTRRLKREQGTTANQAKPLLDDTKPNRAGRDGPLKRGVANDTGKPAAKRSKVEQVPTTKSSSMLLVKRSKVEPLLSSACGKRVGGRQRSRRTNTSVEEAQFAKMIDKYRQKFSLQTFVD